MVPKVMTPRRLAESRARSRGTCTCCFRAPVRWRGSWLCVKCGAKQAARMKLRHAAKRRKHLIIVQAARSLLSALDAGREWERQAQDLRVLLAASERAKGLHKHKRVRVAA